ncbi:MAG: hypothetical protein N3B11_07605 [Coriobacteriia bacterium]|nr:hypothetical protein [Coriobacteriia bacterium]
MEFSLICPRDGQVELGLEDVSAVVFHDPSTCDVVFICPHCGSALRATVKVPHLFRIAIELARLGEIQATIEVLATGDDESPASEEVEPADAGREHAVEAYCEYFRRQLARVRCVEDFLAEVDAGQYQP